MRISITALLTAAAIVSALPGCKEPGDSEMKTEDEEPTHRSTRGDNLAPVATPSASHCSGDTSLEALNDESAPKTSHSRGRCSYGNWPSKKTQWVQYDWTRPISTDRIDVFWWDDKRGVRLPAACRLLYRDGNAFVPVPNASGLGVEKDTYNTTTFDEIVTSTLRLEIDGNGNYSTGILEWKVYDTGKSPAFPPSVNAGVDRVVVSGGRTFLDGSIRAQRGGDRITVHWEKKSGPGSVTFADAGALSTTATFSDPGRYVLELTARKGTLSGSSTIAARVVSPPPDEHIEPVETRPYRIDSPLWSARARAIIVNWIPHCITKISDPALKQGGINNFTDAANKLAGKPHGKHRGYYFSNAWVYNTIESICLALMVDPKGDREIVKARAAMRATLEDWIPAIMAAQEEDGYLQTYFTLNGLPHWDPKHRRAHEGYVAGYLLEAAIAHHTVTKGSDDRLYKTAKRLADCWYRNIGPPPKKEWYNGHQGMEIALLRFGRFVSRVEGEGKGDKYIELSKFLLDCRGGGHEYDQSHVPVVRQYEAVGHAVRASYSYAGMAGVAMETGDVDYHSAVMSLWDNIVNRKYYVTGGIGSGETSEGFGPDYSLRHNAYCESCSSCGEIFFQHLLNLTWRDAKYADLYEETLYNALLGSLDLEGQHFYYQNPLVCNRPRYDWHGCPCCVGNIPRTLLMLPTWMYARDEEGIYVNLFVGSAVRIEDVGGSDVEMVQATDYPRSGTVSITVNPSTSKEFSIRIRVPDRDVSALYSRVPAANGITSIAVNGSKIAPEIESGYAVIRRTWKAGDRIDLELPMTVQRIRGDEKIAATRGQVALGRGPLVYCVESVDQDIDGAIDAKSGLTAAWRADLLDGVTVIRGTWADGSPLTAIPYYARQNRAATRKDSKKVRSTVWIKEK